MKRSSRYVGFERHQVAIHTDVPEILAGLEQHFAYMLQEPGTDLVGSLEVTLSDGLYFIQEQDTYWRNESLDGLFFTLTTEIILRLMQARPDLIWLHAGAVADQGRAVLVSGMSGRGKSTLIVSLCARGWQFLSDDVTPLDPHTGKVLPFPQTPMFRPHPGVEVPADCLAALPKVVAALGPAGVCREAVPVSALVFPQYRPQEPTALTPCSPGAAALELLQNCLNFPVHRENGFHQLCNLVKPLPTYRLAFRSGDEAARLLADAHVNGFRGAETG